MKNFALLSFLFIVIVSSEVRFCRADVSPDAVLDTDGKKLRSSDQYYILSVYSRNSGGLSIGSIQQGKEKCPINILPESYEYLHGLAATFFPINPKKGVVRVSTDLNIQFEASTRCGESTVWKIGKFDQYLKQYFVTIGGVKGNPGRETVGNWFKIEKYGNNYKLVHCPTVCKYCKVICKDVGIFYKNGKRVLALNDSPFPVMFKKV
ncbi:miraculin-like [Benincasa hispida]|uniref:miraculin-like n=1 Tax=Benincasa hispida TaxID=102211 RepID=UPI001901FA1E|nr:miraculin-like [Benincasa hispida]XP_038895399.1 miraculin-like [Benincasa hispida]